MDTFDWYSFNVVTLAFFCVAGFLLLSELFIVQEKEKALKRDRAAFEIEKKQYRLGKRLGG